MCLRDEAPPLQPKRHVLSWPDDAVGAAAAAVAAAAAAAELSVRDDSWLPVGFSAVVVTAYDEITLQKLLTFVSSSSSSGGGGSGGDIFNEPRARYLAGTCSGWYHRNSATTGQPFMIFENSFAYDDDFGTLAAIGALLQLRRQQVEHWHQPVYNNSLCACCCNMSFRCLRTLTALLSPFPHPPAPPTV
jgi:hypothetical protein